VGAAPAAPALSFSSHVITATLAVALALASPAAATTSAATLPKQGVLVPGKSLAGVRLGDTGAQVMKRWGRSYRVCTVCARRTWMFTYRTGSPVGVAVSFRADRVTAIFTLGAPIGWRTPQGVAVGGDVQGIDDIYGAARWSRCIGYGALSYRVPGAVTSIYTSGEIVYGFALMRAGEPVCQ